MNPDIQNSPNYTTIDPAPKVRNNTKLTGKPVTDSSKSLTFKEEYRDGNVNSIDYRGASDHLTSSPIHQYLLEHTATKKRRRCDSSEESGSTVSQDVSSYQPFEHEALYEQTSKDKRKISPAQEPQSNFGRKSNVQKGSSFSLISQHSFNMTEEGESNYRDAVSPDKQLNGVDFRTLHIEHYPSIQNRNKSDPSEELHQTGQNLGLGEKKEKESAGGSELLTAAYNSFVRRIVDDTLDRTITFCEQPRHAIIALEHICSKAWPQLEMKRHRNRIRAYLKACRRNSKKNKGHINMKEPPMNGLSIEARHLVATALSLVSEEVDQLKRNIHSEYAKHRITTTPPILPSTNNRTLPGLQRENFNCTSLINEDLSTSPNTSNSESFNFKVDENISVENFATKAQYPPYCFMTPYPHSGSDNLNANKYITSSSGLVHSPGVFSNPSFYDNVYMAALLRLLPSVLQHTPTVTSFFRTPQLCTTTNSPSNPTTDGELTKDFYVPSWNSSSSNGTNEKFSSSVGTQSVYPVSSFNQDETRLAHNFDYRVISSSYQPVNVESLPPTIEAPPAHINSVQYSSSLNEATRKLLDVRILTKDDVIYFLHNPEVAKEAINYAKGLSRLILKKVEQLEKHLNEANFGIKMYPLNLS